MLMPMFENSCLSMKKQKITKVEIVEKKLAVWRRMPRRE